MQVKLTWDGDMAELLDEASGMSLQDNIIFAMENGGVVYHNEIKIVAEKGEKDENNTRV